MATNALVPTESLPQDEETKAFVYAQCLLANKVTNASAPYDGYCEFLREAQRAPFCALDASATKEREMKGHFREAANAVLQTVLPQTVAALAPTVIALLSGQPLDSAPELKLFSVTRPRKPDDPIVAEAFFLSTPAWSPPTFEAYYVKVQSRKEPQGMFARMTRYEEKYCVSGKCHCSRFTVNTPMLIQYMKGKENVDADIASYLSRATRRAAAQVEQPYNPPAVTDGAFESNYK